MTENLMGAAVRIRRGWHGGKTGKVIACDKINGFASSYRGIKVQLDANGQIVILNSIDDLQELVDQPTGPTNP